MGRRTLARALLALLLFTIFTFFITPVAHADNCSSLADCFPTTDAAAQVTVAVAVLIVVALLALPQLLENAPPAESENKVNNRAEGPTSPLRSPPLPVVGPDAPLTLLGIHHVTAFASDPQRNIDFYTGLLGLRLVKVTVDFDEPNTYQFYYGDASGRPGTILSFVCKPQLPRGTRGTGQVISIALSVPEGALRPWAQYLTQSGIVVSGPSQRFKDQVIAIFDPDGLQIDLIPHRETQEYGPWNNGRIPAGYTLRGLHSVTIAVEQYKQTNTLLTSVLGFQQVGEEGNRHRYQLRGGISGTLLDVVHLPMVPGGSTGTGIVQHVGWRAPAEADQVAWRSTLVNGVGDLNFDVSPIIDRAYFRSLYFREPGRVLFDIATDKPGFLIDERPDQLGTHLMLPPWLEAQRAQLMLVLPQIRPPMMGQGR